MNSATEEFHRIAAVAIDQLLEQDPVLATWLGDHRFDHRLPDMSIENMRTFEGVLNDLLTELDAVDDIELAHEDFVDLEILRSYVVKTQFEVTQVQEYLWNPMQWNPGTAIHLLLSRDFAPEADRLKSARARIAQIPSFLAMARETLGVMSGIHVETAIAQIQGTVSLIATVDQSVETVAALQALQDHIDWLEGQLPCASRSPRRGTDLYAGILWHTLDSDTTLDSLWEAANAHLESVTAELRTSAEEYIREAGISPESDPIRAALSHIASVSPVTNETVLNHVEDALERARAFTISKDIVSVPDIDTQVIEMPEIHRGVAVAYCDSPGPLEEAKLPTFIAVSPTPSHWDAERVDSFYREYNGVQIHDLTIHEAFPGHVLQLAHSNQMTTTSVTRRFGSSGVFVEGWAVYVEEVMVNLGYSPGSLPIHHLALRMQQLKMQCRMVINTLLDIGVHSKNMSESEAMDLMINQGFQEEGEAAGKWRRALLTAGQLPTYFVGYLGVRELALDLQVLHPDWSLRQIHDLMLSFGSPAPRHVRELVGL
jgi:uncharacterized protein (DUF885 family)